jgi:hypothetical protein
VPAADRAEKALGPDHPDIAQSVTNLAGVNVDIHIYQVNASANADVEGVAKAPAAITSQNARKIRRLWRPPF